MFSLCSLLFGFDLREQQFLLTLIMSFNRILPGRTLCVMVKHDRNHSDFYICKVNWILAPFVWSALNIPNFLPDES